MIRVEFGSVFRLILADVVKGQLFFLVDSKVARTEARSGIEDESGGEEGERDKESERESVNCWKRNERVEVRRVNSAIAKLGIFRKLARLHTERGETPDTRMFCFPLLPLLLPPPRTLARSRDTATRHIRGLWTCLLSALGASAIGHSQYLAR